MRGRRPRSVLVVLGRTRRRRPGTSSSSSSLSAAPWNESRISRKPLPSERAASGSFWGPSTISASTAITAISMGTDRSPWRQASEVEGISEVCAPGRRITLAYSRSHGDDPRSVGRAGPARPRRRSQRVLRPALGQGRRGRAGRAGREQAQLAVRLRARPGADADQGQRPGRRGLRGGGLPLAPAQRGRALADRHQPGPVPALAVADRLAGRPDEPVGARLADRRRQASTRNRSRSRERRRRDARLPVVRAPLTRRSGASATPAARR